MKANVIKFALTLSLLLSLNACQTVPSPSKGKCCDSHQSHEDSYARRWNWYR